MPLHGLSAQIIQECVTLVVFVVFAYFYLREPIRWNYALSFACIVGAVFFAFWGGGDNPACARTLRRACDEVAPVPLLKSPGAPN